MTTLSVIEMTDDSVLSHPAVSVERRLLSPEHLSEHLNAEGTASARPDATGRGFASDGPERIPDGPERYDVREHSLFFQRS